MPREWTETIYGRKKPDVSRVYRVRVWDVKRSKKPPGILVELEFLDWDRLGRMHSQVLPLPIEEDSITALFLQACGMECVEGEKVVPKKAKGAEIGVHFTAEPGSANWMITRFERLEENDESVTESTAVSEPSADRVTSPLRPDSQ